MRKSIPIKTILLDTNSCHILIKCTLNHEVYFIIDTGASKSVIDESLLTEIKHSVINADSIETSELTGMINGKIVSIDQIKIGDINFANFQALSMPLEHVKTIYKQFTKIPIGGLLGSDFLKEKNATIMYKRNSLTLEI